jgi:hypothetical protein
VPGAQERRHRAELAILAERRVTNPQVQRPTRHGVAAEGVVGEAVVQRPAQPARQTVHDAPQLGGQLALPGRAGVVVETVVPLGEGGFGGGEQPSGAAMVGHCRTEPPSVRPQSLSPATAGQPGAA